MSPQPFDMVYPNYTRELIPVTNTALQPGRIAQLSQFSLRHGYVVEEQFKNKGRGLEWNGGCITMTHSPMLSGDALPAWCPRAIPFTFDFQNPYGATRYVEIYTLGDAVPIVVSTILQKYPNAHISLLYGVKQYNERTKVLEGIVVHDRDGDLYLEEYPSCMDCGATTEIMWSHRGNLHRLNGQAFVKPMYKLADAIMSTMSADRVGACAIPNAITHDTSTFMQLLFLAAGRERDLFKGLCHYYMGQQIPTEFLRESGIDLRDMSKADWFTLELAGIKCT